MDRRNGANQYAIGLGWLTIAAAGTVIGYTARIFFRTSFLQHATHVGTDVILLGYSVLAASFVLTVIVGKARAPRWFVMLCAMLCIVATVTFAGLNLSGFLITAHPLE